VRRIGTIRALLLTRRLITVGACLAVLTLGLVGPIGAQPVPLDGVPIDPAQLRNQVSQTLARLVLDRPIALAQQAAAIAGESGQLTHFVATRLSAGQGPNGGPPPMGLDVEIGQLTATAVECAQRAQQNVRFAAQDLEVLKGVLGGQLDLDDDPGPDGSLRIVQWLTGMVSDQRQRNAAIEQCVNDAALGLGRLRAYRSLYPG
jgi:hypothetical protein